MGEYGFLTDPIEIISGTSNRTSPVYIEAVRDIEEGNSKALGYIKNFMTSIDRIRVKDSRISSSKGNIQKFSGYENVKTSIAFLSKTIPGSIVLKNLVDIFRALEGNQLQYTEGYSKRISLIMLEYEAAVDMLVTGLSFTIANSIDVQAADAHVIMRGRPEGDGGALTQTIADMARQLRDNNHKIYLDGLIKVKSDKSSSAGNDTTSNSVIDEDLKESVMTERVVADTIDILSALYGGVSKIGSFVKNTLGTIKRSLFGIIPLIRSWMYLKYKRKADTILSLEQQMGFIRMNIEQLKNIKAMDPNKKQRIIKKQQAEIERFRKKAEKLRAELVDASQVATTSVKQDNPKIREEKDDLELD